MNDYLVLLQFSQKTSFWTVTCPELSLQFQSINRSPQELVEIIKDEVAMASLSAPDWLTENLPQTTNLNYEYEF